MDKKERGATGEDTKVVEYVLVIEVGNYNSVTKRICITQLETLIDTKEATNKNEYSPSLQET